MTSRWKTPLEHYDAAAFALDQAEAQETSERRAAAAAVAEAHLHAAEVLLSIHQAERPKVPSPQVVIR